MRSVRTPNARWTPLFLSLALVTACTNERRGAGAVVSSATWDSELPPVTLAEVERAPGNTHDRPKITITVTTKEVVLDARELVSGVTSEATPALAREVQRYELTAIVKDHLGHELRNKLERLFEPIEATGVDPFTKPLIRLRVAADVPFEHLKHVLSAAGAAGFGSYELEVSTATGRGQLVLLPYMFCACPMPKLKAWCAVPELYITSVGVTLHAEADLIPPPGCHKTIPALGQDVPPFNAAVDWRTRAIAGPDGQCPSAQVGPRGVDAAALTQRIQALHGAGPGCGHGILWHDRDTRWSEVAGPLSVLAGEFGDIRLTISIPNEARLKELAAACGSPMPVSALSSERTRSPRPAGRPGCAD